jgi:glycosyltransferase involved in cell wall biosynthesis
MSPRVSVVVPCYKAAAFIRRTLDSVANQTFADWELIVVDDGSPDASAEVIAARIADDPRMRLVRQPNSYVCAARNNGFAHASAESRYLLFLDADDVLFPDALRTLVEYLDRHADVGTVYCSLQTIDPSDRPVEEAGFGEAWHVRFSPTRRWFRKVAVDEPEVSLAETVSGFHAIPSCTLIRRSVYERCGGWDESFRNCSEDADLVIRLALIAPVHFLPLRLVGYRRHPSNSSNVRLWIGLKQLRAKWLSGEPVQNVSRSDLVRVRQAFAFDRKLTAYLQARVALDALGRRDLRLASAELRQSARSLGAYALLRGRAWSQAA